MKFIQENYFELRRMKLLRNFMIYEGHLVLFL